MYFIKTEERYNAGMKKPPGQMNIPGGFEKILILYQLMIYKKIITTIRVFMGKYSGYRYG